MGEVGDPGGLTSILRGGAFEGRVSLRSCVKKRLFHHGLLVFVFVIFMLFL